MMPLLTVDCLDHIEHYDTGGESYRTKHGVVTRSTYDPPLFLIQHKPGAECILCEAESRRSLAAAARQASEAEREAV